MRLSKVGLIVILALSVLVGSPAGEGQPPAKIARIGFLGNTPWSHLTEAFRQGLRELGYVEGQNVVIEWRFAEGRLQRLPDLAVELVRLRVEVIVVTVSQAAVAAKNATGTIPIVTVAIGDPVATGLVGSLARPGGNITGLSFVVGPEIGGKLLELLKEAAPHVSRVAVLWNPTNPTAALLSKEVEAAARVLGVELQILKVQDSDELDGAFGAMTRGHAHALLVVPDPLFFGERARLQGLAALRGLPTMYGWREAVEAGGLMSYGPDLRDLYRRAPKYIDKILKGAKPVDLPMERPTKFELVINLKTAKALGLTIPPSVLLRADHLIDEG